MAKTTEFRESAYRLGIPIRVREMEAELQAYQRDYPEFFLSETSIQLLRPESRNGWGGPRVGAGAPKPAAGAHTAQMREQRTRTNALLDWFAAKATRTTEEVHKHGADMRAIYQLTANGYLLRRGNLITRTRKAFVVDKSVAERERRHAREQARTATVVKKKKPGMAAKKNGYTAKRDAQRQKTADYLAQFDSDEARLFPSNALGAYVRRGYLKPKGDGYVRTAKEFVVQV